MNIRAMTEFEQFSEHHQDCEYYCTKGPCEDCPYKSGIDLKNDSCSEYFSVFHFDRIKRESYGKN